jgi:hypothetical protein
LRAVFVSCLTKAWTSSNPVLNFVASLRPYCNPLLPQPKKRKALLPSIQIMGQDDAQVDMTKVVIKVDGLTGAQLYKKLDEKRIDIEKYT